MASLGRVGSPACLQRTRKRRLRMHIYPGDKGLAIAVVPRRSEWMRTDCSVTHARDRPRQYHGTFCRIRRKESDGRQARFCHSLGTRGSWRGVEFVPGRWTDGRRMLSGESVSWAHCHNGVIDWSWFPFLFSFWFFSGFWFLVFLSAFAFALLLSLGGAKPTGGWPAEGDD